MQNKKVVFFLMLFLLTGCLFSKPRILSKAYQSLGNPFLSIILTPGILLPLSSDSELFSPGALGMLCGELKITHLPFLHLHTEAGYLYVPVKAETLLSIIPFGAGPYFKINITPRLEAKAGISFGYHVGILSSGPFNQEALTGGSPWLSAKVGSSYFITPSLSLGIEGSYINCFGLARFLSVCLGASYHIQAPGSGSLEIENVEIAKIFPILFQHYDEKPPGKATISNRGRFTITDLEATLFVKQYMSHPTNWKIPISIGPAEEKEIEIKALFSERVLGIIEGTKVPAELSISYNYHGRQYAAKQTATINLHDRNSLTWDDDRKAALFVSEKDPAVLSFAGCTASLINNSAFRPINSNLRMAVGLHSALSSYGMTYVIDPKSSYTELTKDKLSIDFLKFPRQTLRHKAGDCDDLSVLYCALLESVGIETAFIIVPGHIYTAFSLDMTPEEAAKLFSSIDDLIFRGNKAWLPVEITELSGGFLKAWQRGAKQWRENDKNQSAKLLPMHESWQAYAPVGLPAGEVEISYPPEEWVMSLYDKEIIRFINKELKPKVQVCLERIRESQGSPRAINRLGVLYARYGLYDQAELEFQKILQKEEYMPALINLGNIYYLHQDFQKALECFERALRIDQKHSKVLLGLTRTHYELELYQQTREYYNRLKIVEPELAGRFAYLVVRKKEAQRADSLSFFEKEVIWQEE